MVSLYLFLVSVFVGCYGQQEQNSPLPVTNNTTVISGIEGCPTQQVRDDRLSSIRNEVNNHLVNTVTPHLSCPCGGAGEWSKIASLDMTDPNQQCPFTWSLNTFSGIRGCGRTTDTACDSVSYPSNGRTYSRVCGKIIAYQQGSPNAFHLAVIHNVGLESPYVDGISLTHGAPGSRSHIWTYAVALNDFGLVSNSFICSCTNSNPWPYTVPSFISNNYFCDTGDHDAGFVNEMNYPDEPLFDGQGCGPDSTCCQFNTPPWFCTELPQPTSDDLEIRICGNDPVSSEDVVISMIDIYIR